MSGKHDGARYAVNISLLFTEVPLLDRPAAVAEAGFSLVECWWPFETAAPSDREVGRFIDSIAVSGVQLIQMNLFGGDLSAGDRGIISCRARASEFVASLAVSAEVAALLGCRYFNCLYGTHDPSAGDYHSWRALDLIVGAADRLQPFGATLLFEPLSACPGYPFETPEAVFELINLARLSYGVPNLGLLADLYHLAVNRIDYLKLLREGRLPMPEHVQIAGVPGRHEPGSDTGNLASQLHALGERGYPGVVSLEYVPTTSSADSLRSVRSWLDSLRGSAPSALHR